MLTSEWTVATQRHPFNLVSGIGVNLKCDCGYSCALGTQTCPSCTKKRQIGAIEWLLLVGYFCWVIFRMIFLHLLASIIRKIWFLGR